MTDKEIREFSRREAERHLRDHKYACKAVQDELRCPNCGTIWECQCGLAQVEAAVRRIRARHQAEWHARLRRIDEEQKRKLAEWHKTREKVR